MIKFWKNAAKGKSGCPVRPPEKSAESSTLVASAGFRYTLETISEEGFDLMLTSNKKSRLTMTLHDVLHDRNTLRYFVEYMESSSDENTMKFWLEIEKFKMSAMHTINSTGVKEKRGKLTRTTSLGSSIKLKHIAESAGDDAIANSCQDLNNCTQYNLCNTAIQPSSLCNCQVNRLDHYEPLSSKALVDVALEIFKNFIALEAPYKIDLPDNIRNTIVQNICHPEGLIDSDCFKVAQEVVLETLDRVHKDFIKSPLYTKAQIDILTSGSLNLDDILYNEMTLFYFTEYLEQESCSILLECLMALTNFSDNLIGKYEADQAQDDAIILYDKYFSLQAMSPIGFPTEVRTQVEQNICQEGGPLPDCFHIPFRIIHCTLSKLVKPFLESELYLKYLTEMINSVDKSWKKKSLSDCSSEFSINTQNTLLAMGDPHFKSRRRNNSVPDMSIDSRQLYNADSLWKRRQDGLSLGRINSLGRFESKLEPDPDKVRPSVFKKMVNRLVPSSAARVDEEMAWQVAHMIVKDVTDLTMAPSRSDT